MNRLLTETNISRRNLLMGGMGLGAFAVLGLAGCSNEGRGGGALTGNATVALPTYIPYDGVPIDIKGTDGVPDTMLKYPASPKKVTNGQPGDGEDVGIFGLTNTPVPPGADKNAYWQELHERLGFALTIALTPAGDYSDRFQTTVAGDRLPDIFEMFSGDVPGLPSLLEERATDLTEYLSGDAVKKYPFLANIPTESWQSCVYNGKIFAVPVPRGPAQSNVFYARQDWFEAEGIDPNVTSAEEFYDLCKELSGGNTWALGRVPLGHLRQMFEIPNGWSEDGGKLTSANLHERQQEALELGRRLVADGFVHPDGVPATQPQRKTWLVNGTIRMLDDTFSAWPDFSNYPIDENFRLAVAAPPLAEGGGTAGIHLGAPVQNITSISKKSEGRVEALLDVINYLAAPFGSEEHLFRTYGVEGVHHELDGTDPVLTEQGRTEIQLGLKYVVEGPWVNFQAGDPDVAQAEHDAQAAVVPTAVANPVQGLFSDTASRKGGQLGEKLVSTESDIMAGRKPVTAWADAASAWAKGGGDTIRDEYQKALAERQG
ncbi:extracellular solute-binding protein [Promicromonospora sukumoe]|uniref:Putative aldouronate transport system substrate-binding protein n=1 Tax=Promicromonospora sukumoe TaxID=88382 RepID=A0A7W3JA95_9MICO|nr:extracellular solute-binding protein [Promicromonospora sukumoe]MBA8809034.1 putative aldouronate transport system substrate-binding protein [Promicromonospora sukumoe]